METSKNKTMGLVNFVQVVGGPEFAIVIDSYFSSIARTSVELSVFNGELQSILFTHGIDENSEDRIRQIVRKMSRLCDDVNFGILNRWTDSLDEAREIVANHLTQNLSKDILNTFLRHKEGEIEPFSPESVSLCEQVLQKLRIGEKPPRLPFQPMPVEYASWLIVDHMLYQLRGSCSEDAQTADTVEKCFNDKCAIPKKALVGCSNYLLDQFLSEKASAKKYGRTEQYEMLLRDRELYALEDAEAQ